MANLTCSSFICFTFLAIFTEILGEDLSLSANDDKRVKKPDQIKKLLFVFGDSYVDTGNWEKNVYGGSWVQPYGMTHPGRPAGRFSDGRVLTDYIASFLGIRSPLPYQWRKLRPNMVKYGMNFAYGGTGVFDTLVNGPNMTAQINSFSQLLKENLYTKKELESSIALVTLAGNDYTQKNGSTNGLPALINSIVNKLVFNLVRLHNLGVKKIAVTTIEPIGCLPFFTILNGSQSCNELRNGLAKVHNEILINEVRKLNNKTKNSPFYILDLYDAFISALTTPRTGNDILRYKHSLKPCCMGASNKDICGSTNEKGVKKYKVCATPTSFFFWDMVHPSQMGWQAISAALKPSVHKLSAS